MGEHHPILNPFIRFTSADLDAQPFIPNPFRTEMGKQVPYSLIRLSVQYPLT
jgi:hypothetical protein